MTLVVFIPRNMLSIWLGLLVAWIWLIQDSVKFLERGSNENLIKGINAYKTDDFEAIKYFSKLKLCKVLQKFEDFTVRLTWHIKRK